MFALGVVPVLGYVSFLPTVNNTGEQHESLGSLAVFLPRDLYQAVGRSQALPKYEKDSIYPWRLAQLRLLQEAA